MVPHNSNYSISTLWELNDIVLVGTYKASSEDNC